MFVAVIFLNSVAMTVLVNSDWFRFSSLPRVIYQFKRLEILMANDNQISEFDAEGLCQMPMIATLALQNNSISSLPLQLGNCTQLRFASSCSERNNYESIVDVERACRTVVTGDCYHCFVHLHSTSHCMIIFTPQDEVLFSIDFFVSLFVCLFIYLFVSLSARLRENGRTYLYDIFREGVEWP